MLDRCRTCNFVARLCRTSARLYRATKSQTLRLSSCTLRLIRVKAKFHYTGPTGPDRTRADPHGLWRRPARTQRSFSETRAAKKVREGPVRSGRARVVEFSQYQTKCADFVWSVRSGRVRVVEFSYKQTRLLHHFSRFTTLLHKHSSKMGKLYYI